MEPRLKTIPLMKCVAAIAAASIALSLGGCYKHYENKADTNIKQAANWKADKFDESKSTYENAVKILEQARQAKASKTGDPGKLAKDAALESEKAVEQAKTRYADTAKTQAQKDIQVASINDGPSQNPALFSKAEANMNAAIEKYNKQKYEDSIELSTLVSSDIDQLLASLKNNAENNLSTLEARMIDLRKAEADQYNPQPIVKGDEATSRIREKITADRDYKNAILMAGAAISDVEAAIIESKKKHSEAELRLMEEKIATAIAEEAPIHVADALKKEQDRFEAILVGFYEKQYDSVLSAADSLKPDLDKLITMARIEATKDLIGQVEAGIRRLQDQSVEVYLPGRVKAMEDLLAQSKDKFNNNDYEGSKFEAKNGLLEQDRIVNSFDTLAETTIQDAEKSVKGADSTYARMNQIFGPGGPGVDSRLQARYQVRAAELKSQLDQSVARLSSSNGNRGTKEFKQAIEEARSAHGIADGVANGTYGLVSQNALLGIQDQISQLERQGAREYAPSQLNEVQQLVERSQKLITETQYREAVESTAKARAYLENVKQELARQAQRETGGTQNALRRLEGGAAPMPAAGGQPAPGRQVPYGQNPGGSELSNIEMILEDARSEAAKAEAAAGTQLIAQSSPGSAGHQTLSSGYTGDASYFGNRQLPSGTFMKSGSPGPVFLGTDAQNGAIVGTRAEAVVPEATSTGSYIGGSTGSYEPPTAPGPFVALGGDSNGGAASADPVSGGAAASGQPDALTMVHQKIDEILLDEKRANDIRVYRGSAIESARQKLAESSAALAKQEYLNALTFAQEAQRIVVTADQEAARISSEKNLKDAADRINLAEASGAIMFAPAELNEAVRLYEQGKSFLDQGNVVEARTVSERALIAAEEARLYNVNKARDLASLSARYGGWKSSHPALVESEMATQHAEKLLNNPQTAPMGQEYAKQAVTMAQIALDAARDFTFQERIDNIYKALNTALRAGANYFNVAEVKRLMAELTVAREEYCTRNFDAVELKLKDIEVRLARVIESTPLVLEQNLIDTTEKLNALIMAGANNWMAQEVDEVKTLMNISVIDFRKHDYYSSYTNIRNAMGLCDRVEERMQEQVYYDAVTELFAQMDVAIHDFELVLNNDRAFLKKLVSSAYGQPNYVNFSGRTNPNDFKDRIVDLYLRTIHLKPPKSLEATHSQVILAVKYAKVCAENFQKLFILDQVSMPDAYDIIDTAYDQFIHAKRLRSEVQVKLIEPEARTKVLHADKIVNW